MWIDPQGVSIVLIEWLWVPNSVLTVEESNLKPKITRVEPLGLDNIT